MVSKSAQLFSSPVEASEGSVLRILCSNYDCKNYLTNYEINYKKLRGKFRFCHKCRQSRGSITKNRCLQCGTCINLATYNRKFCDECVIKRERQQRRDKYHRDKLVPEMMERKKKHYRKFYLKHKIPYYENKVRRLKAELEELKKWGMN